MPPEMNQQRRQPGLPPNYPSQSGQYPGGQQFSPNSQPQRYGMMSTPGRMMPGQMGQMNQSYNQQVNGRLKDKFCRLDGMVHIHVANQWYGSCIVIHCHGCMRRYSQLTHKFHSCAFVVVSFLVRE